MSFASMLVHDLTIVRPGTTTDRYGNVTKDWSNPTETAVKGWVAQQEGTEVLDGRDAQIRRWICYLPAGTDITGSDRVVWGTVTFEVSGPPNRAWHPSMGEHHVEAVLLAVVG